MKLQDKIGDKKIIVSLTTWRKRIDIVHKTINSILSQSVRVDKIVLTLSLEEFSIDDLPESLTSIDDSRLEIRWVTGNPKVFKKLIPTLDAYPDDIIITVNDDIMYPVNALELILNGYTGENPITSKECEYTLGSAVPSGALTVYERKYFGDLLHFFDCPEIYSLNEDDWVYWCATILNGYHFDYISGLNLSGMQNDTTNGMFNNKQYNTSFTLQFLIHYCKLYFNVDVLNIGKQNSKLVYRPNSINKNIRPLTSFVLSKCNASSMKASKGLSTAIFTSAKDEDDYIEEWVKYHLNIGFDKIYIVDNNEKNSPKLQDILSQYIAEGKVEIEDYRGIYDSPNHNQVLQVYLMDLLYKKHSHLYDWFAVIDIDEFITLDSNRFKSIKDFVSMPMFDRTNIIKLKWKIMTDNNLLRYEKGNVVDRFTEESEFPSDHFKCLYRTGFNYETGVGTHTTKNISDISCMSNGVYNKLNGNPLDKENNKDLSYDNCYIRHYYTKSLEEFFNKRIKKGGMSRQEHTDHRNEYIENFWNINKRTPEKEAMLSALLNNQPLQDISSPSEPLKARIFILGYKQFDCPVHNKDLYSIVNLKAKRSIRNTTKHHYDVPIIYTDKGDSISDRNDIYDEWTGIYWLWKNYDFSNLDYVGLCQYRRYFEFLDEPAFDILKDYDLTTGGFVESQNNNTVNFRIYHNLDDLKALGRYISDPEDIRHTVSFLSSNVFYPSNILFMKKELFFEFCEFVFGYIFKYQEGEGLTTIEAIESRILQNPDAYPANGRTPEENVKYQRQLVAFLMERLTNIWITKYNETHNIMRVSCIETEHTGQGIFKYQPVENK